MKKTKQKEKKETRFLEKNVLEKLKKVELEILDEVVRICEKHNLTYVLTAGTLIGAKRHKGFIPWDDDIDIALPRKDFDKLMKLCKTELNKEYFLDCMDTNDKYWLQIAKVRKKNTIYEEQFQANYDGCKGIWIDILPLDNSNTDKSIFLWIRGKSIRVLRDTIHVRSGFSKLSSESLIKYIIKIPIYILSKLFSIKTLQKFEYKLMSLNKNDDSKYIVNFASRYGYKKQTFPREKYFPTTKIEFENKVYNAPNDTDYILSKIYGSDYMKMPPKEKRVTHCPRRIKFEGEEEIFYGEEI